jgi:hypothetical protein
MVMQSVKVSTVPRVLTVLLILLTCSCALPFSAAAATPTPPPDPRYVITRLGDQPPPGPAPRPATIASSIQSFRVSMQVRITAPGGTEELRQSVTGEFALPDRAHTTTVLSDSLSADTDTFDWIAIGKDNYLYFDQIPTAAGPGAWVLFDDPEFANQPDGRDITSGADLLNLVNVLPILPGTEIIGDETINGVLTTHTRATVDARTYVGAADYVPTELDGARVHPLLTLDLWTGKSDNFPRHLTLTGNLFIDPARLLGQMGSTPSSDADLLDAVTSYAINGPGKVPAPASFVMDFTDLNAPVTIDAPATFVKLSDLFKEGFA